MPTTAPMIGPSTYIIPNDPIPSATAGFKTPFEIEDAKEIPIMRLESALNQNRTMFRAFSVPKPFASTKDIFCLRTTRTVNHYRKISLHNLLFEVPSVSPGQEVDVKIRPEPESGQAEIRIWHQEKLVATKIILLKDLPQVHL